MIYLCENIIFVLINLYNVEIPNNCKPNQFNLLP